jgi:hypothetical protein
MKHETRLNLIFLSVFLAISIPGAVILFIRKLDPSAAPMYLPDPVRQRLPYMAPQWTPDEVTRVIPPITGQWIEQLNHDQGTDTEVLLRERLPLLSTDRLLQVTGIKTAASTMTVYVVAWDNFGSDARHYVASLATGGNKQTAKIRVARIPMPDPVRKELLTAGYVKPRPWIAWIELEFDAPPKSQQPQVVQVTYNDGANVTTSSVNLFTQ